MMRPRIPGTVYLHWPYCKQRCSYCNFNKYIERDVDHSRMKNCLIKEMRNLLDMSGINSIKSIYFGGGTPSLAPPDTLAAVIDVVSPRLIKNPEITIEVNPTIKETKKLREFKSIGCNRVSIGIQALNNFDLKLLNRDHTVEEATNCLEVAKSLFPSVSCDLIFKRSYQTLETLSEEVNKLIQLELDHLSLYQLTLERGTQLFKDVTNGKIMVPDNDVGADMYDMIVDKLENAGLQRYEVSNFAKASKESQHNLSYWNCTEYLGVGPGAHGRFIPRALEESQREARIQTLEPIPWMIEVERYGHATRKRTKLNKCDILIELLIVGLRTVNGIKDELWSKFSDGESLEIFFSQTDQDICYLFEENFLEMKNTCLKATPKGLKLLDSILPILINLINKKLSI